MNTSAPTHSPIDDAADQAVAVLLMECQSMDASGRAVVLGKVLAKVAQATESQILTPRSIAFIAHQKADQIIMEARHVHAHN
jgi:hypothetical protein